MWWTLRSCFLSMLFETASVPFTSYCSCVCVYAGNICAFRVPLILPSRDHMSGGSFVCQHGASLTSWVLLKVRMEERLRGLCPLEPSWASVSSLLTAYSLFFQSMCICTGSWVGTVGLGVTTWAGLLRSESLQEDRTGLGRRV